MARAPGKAYIKKFTNPQGQHIGYKSSTKWGKVKYWRNSEGGLAKAKEHSGVDHISEDVPTNNLSAGNIKGVGGAGGEPGVKAKWVKKYQAQNAAAEKALPFSGRKTFGQFFKDK